MTAGFRQLTIISLVLGGASLPAAARAQTQPANATNAQDEVVNVVKGVGENTSDLTIFRTGDKAEMNNYVSEVVELRNAVALELIPHVLRAVRLEKGAARALTFTDPETQKVRHFIQVVTTAEQMPSVLETIRTFDLTGIVASEGDTKYHYRLNNRKASEVATILANTVLSGDGKVFFDNATNTVYFQDLASKSPRNIEALKFYDAPSPQVEFEVTVVEIDSNDRARLGLDWDAWKMSAGGQFEWTANDFEGPDAFSRIDSLVTVDAAALTAFLNYTVMTGTAKATTRTVLTATNGSPAVYSSLRRLPYYGHSMVFATPVELTEDVPGVTARGVKDDNNPVGKRPVAIVPPTRAYMGRVSEWPNRPGGAAFDPSLQQGTEKTEGMYLVIDPTIGRTLVTADVRVVVNSLSGETETGEPIISERLVSTRVTLKDGEPFTLGGLAKDTEVKTRRGIPGLKEIPVLKYLFSVDSTRKRTSKTYVIVTPRFNNQLNYEASYMNNMKLDADRALGENPAKHVPGMQEGVADFGELVQRD